MQAMLAFFAYNIKTQPLAIIVFNCFVQSEQKFKNILLTYYFVFKSDHQSEDKRK